MNRPEQEDLSFLHCQAPEADPCCLLRRETAVVSAVSELATVSELASVPIKPFLSPSSYLETSGTRAVRMQLWKSVGEAEEYRI